MSGRTQPIPIMVVLMLVLAACGSPASSSAEATVEQSSVPSAESTAPSAEPTSQELITFTQGYIPGLNHLPEVIAMDHAADFGLDLQEITFTTVPDTITGLVRGDVDLMINTPSTAISGRDQGIPLVVVGGGYFRSTGLVVAGDLGIEPEDWDAFREAAADAEAAGQKLRLGAAASVSTNWVECYFTLLDNGIDPEVDLEIVNIPAFSEHPGALERGDVDMVCTSEPFSTLSQTNGGGVLFTHPFDTAAGDSLGALVTTEEVLADSERREGIRRYIALYDHAVQLINDDPELAVETAMAIMKTSDRDLATHALAATKFDVSFSKEEFQEVARMHHEIGQTNEDWSDDVDVWTDDEFVRELD